MSKENVILIDYDAPNDWEFHKAIEQLLITQFIIKKGEDYQKISELLHMIAEQH